MKYVETLLEGGADGASKLLLFAHHAAVLDRIEERLRKIKVSFRPLEHSLDICSP